MRVLVFVFFAALLGGCAGYPVNYPQVQIRSNIPWHTTTVTIVNNTSFVLNVVHDGRLVRQDLKPGQYFTAELYNFSTASTQSSFVVIARDGDKLAGTASRSFYIGGYSRQSEVWIIGKWEVRD
ncbi:hypothetical protein A3A20_02650 [Candidatus Wolfebacteria bacterium RIFCSPLOWO2_01_FULL_45_19]|uniref:Uncharacterized protein n=1 Tax=Candidatus Wolfebacteria bacterium RIFCSPLOWO2_01_FULL_45_19 TaxID=1802557 RepID=A0A1F8DS43_9BACT|nr:MAG: hypothetical protein UX23_C0012G0018 [Parcubacteria group bacterium GW2011_GWB1_45_9]OGM91447.1 MAG: hypothetical protein A3A20_02650 [Candidatus Wolfebacteria bacterium RIFCSPLOWO2_01_FULL_45_19]